MTVFDHRSSGCAWNQRSGKDHNDQEVALAAASPAGPARYSTRDEPYHPRHRTGQQHLDAPIGGGEDWPGYTYVAGTVRSLLPILEQMGVVTPEEAAEEGTWKIVHLHGDPITIPRTAESVIRR